MFYEIKETPVGVTSGTPVINELIIPRGTGIYAQRRFNVRLLVEWIKRTPEALGILRAIANDVITRISFRKVDTTSMGRPSKSKGDEKVRIAQDFAAQHRVKEVQIASIMDMFMTGDFYIWIGMLDNKQIDTAGNKIGKEIYSKYGLDYKALKIRKFIDEDLPQVQDIRYVPSETVEIDFDETEVLGYIQTTFAPFRGPRGQDVISPHHIPSGFERRYWKPKQIIHGKFMDMSGKVYGTTPMSAATPIIRTIGLIKDYTGNYFENGGLPDYLFMFESEGFTNKQNVNELKEELQKYKSSANKHGHLVGETSGRFNATKLNDNNKDMEYRALMIQYVGHLAFSLGFPSVRLKAIVGKDIKGSTGETDADTDAYQRNIENMQDYVLNLWNTQLWIPQFGVKQELLRGYRQDEVREVQRDVQRMAYLSSASKGAIKINFTEDYIRQYLNVDEKDIKSIDFEEEDSFGDINKQAPLPNSKVFKGQAGQAHSEEKKKQAPTDPNKQMGN